MPAINPSKAETDRYKLPLYTDGADPDLRDEYNRAMEKIDLKMGNIEDSQQTGGLTVRGTDPVSVTTEGTTSTVGLKIGNGLAKNTSTGMLEVPVDGVTIGYSSDGLHVIDGGGGGEGYTLPTASTTVLGGVKSSTATAADDVNTYVNPVGGKMTGEIRPGAVTTDKIADKAVTNEKLADGAVDSRVIKDGSITGDDIAKNTITSEHIKDGTITPDDLDKNHDWSGLGGKSINFANKGIKFLGTIPNLTYSCIACDYGVITETGSINRKTGVSSTTTQLNRSGKYCAMSFIDGHAVILDNNGYYTNVSADGVISKINRITTTSIAFSPIYCNNGFFYAHSGASLYVSLSGVAKNISITAAYNTILGANSKYVGLSSNSGTTVIVDVETGTSTSGNTNSQAFITPTEINSGVSSATGITIGGLSDGTNTCIVGVSKNGCGLFDYRNAPSNLSVFNGFNIRGNNLAEKSDCIFGQELIKTNSNSTFSYIDPNKPTRCTIISTRMTSSSSVLQSTKYTCYDPKNDIIYCIISESGTTKITMIGA